MFELDRSFRTGEVEKALEGVLAADDIKGFLTHFGMRLGLFRDFKNLAVTNSLTDAHEYMDRFLGRIVEFLADLTNMPSSVRAYALDACFVGSSGSFEFLVDRLSGDLVSLETMIASVKVHEEMSVQIGRPYSKRRDVLLVETVQKLMSLGVPYIAAVRACAATFSAARIELPAELAEVRRLYKRTLADIGEIAPKS